MTGKGRVFGQGGGQWPEGGREDGKEGGKETPGGPLRGLPGGGEIVSSDRSILPRYSPEVKAVSGSNFGSVSGAPVDFRKHSQTARAACR